MKQGLTNSEILLAMNKDTSVSSIKTAFNLMQKGMNDNEILLAMNNDVSIP